MSIWEKIAEFFKKIWDAINGNTTTTTTIIPPIGTTTTTTPSDNGDNNFVPNPLYEPKYNIDNATEQKIGGGFVWNCDNSRKKGKSIWPTKYINKLAWVTYFTQDGSFKEIGDRTFPNEYGPRARYYNHKTPIGSLPKSIYLRAHVVDNGIAQDVWVYIPDTQKRWE